MSKYGVTVQVKDADGGSFLARAIRGVGRLLGSTEGSGEVSWTREAAAMEDRIPEWLRLDMDWEGPGRYEIVVEVQDLATEVTATATRVVEVVP